MKALILWGIGMSGGIAVAAGLFTFLVITGIPHRLMTITHTTAYGGWYEWMFVLGGALGNAVWLTDTAVKIPAGMFLAGAAGLLVGIFIGCLIGAIAEVLDALPGVFQKNRYPSGHRCRHFLDGRRQNTGGLDVVFHIDINASIK